jgi:hypothetical protein
VNDKAAEYLRRLVAEQPELARRSFYRRSEVHASAEFMRIVSLPRRTLDFDAVPDLTPLWALPNGTMRLWPVQSAALLEAERCGGLFAALPVGGGKTLLAALLPDAMKSKCAVIIVPAQMKRKTLETTWPALSAHFALPLDRITLVSYTQLERAPGDVLDRLQPDLVIADEAHLLKNKDAARTARFLRYFKEHPETRLVAMSGTFTNQSIHDYAHLLRLCLRDGSPLPRDFMTLDEWSEALDVNVEDPRPAGALDRLCTVDTTHTGTAESDSERIHVHSTTRDRFRCRLTSTPGVVALESGFKGTELRIRRREVAPPPKILAAIDRLRKSWVIGNPEIPEDASEEITDGPRLNNSVEEVCDDLTFARLLRQLACGFYLKWNWPNGARDQEWLGARSQWNGVVRHILRYSRRPGLDSPMLVAGAASRGELAKEHQSVWEQWAAVKDRKQPPTVAVWIDDYLVRDAVRWIEDVGAGASASGIIWYESPTFGEALGKALAQRLPEVATDIVMDGRPQVLSIHKFGTGVDGLQRVYDRCLYTTVPNAKQIEQSLGRLHREGQSRAVTADIYLPIPECFDALDSTKRKAQYAEETGFGEQKILHCKTEGM